ncbi:MAG TPA: glycoside hydrolase family 99-like domain-containing protein, partial [Anaerolineales bacterium]|nr:glycoside hydrolase family 99-like domain-containing protein [Anaerolineales bacterium]
LPSATQAPTLTATILPTPTASPTATVPPRPNEYITIAQLNLWYHGPGCYGGFEAFDCSGKRTTALTPLLGRTYDSADPAVIKQQIDWAAAYGVDAFSLEWTTPSEVGGSLEPNIDNAFLKAPNLNKIRWCIFYDLVLRLDQTPGLHVDLSGGMNFNDPQVANTFVADFDHFARKYFSQPEYLKIDGRPVVYVWGTWNAIGNYAGVFAQARQKALADGYDVFIVGDIVRADVFNRSLAASYDANTNFIMLIPGLSAPKDEGKAAAAVDQVLARWQADIKGLKVAGRQETVSLEPGFAPQFDNRLFSPGNFAYTPALSQDQVTAMAEVARKYAQPVGSQGWKLVWLNTWNDWAETTTFEPTIDQGPKYPAGNYGFDMLDVVKNVFGPETFPVSTP